MNPPRTRVHLVCNAHLDPVWLWQWEDGLTEALSTFRVACDFCDDFPGFIFCHNEAVLYKWVEDNDPALFARIRRLVKEGRWHIAGGSYVQADVNLPSGESHIRQFLYGKAYFRRAFGKAPTTAYNFDSFGHAVGYAQILAGCGFDSYVFTRPRTHAWRRLFGAFRWRDRSGAEVMMWRSAFGYPTRHDAYDKLSKTLSLLPGSPDVLFLWGVGNHGGGPSRKDYRQIQEFARDHPECEIVHSTPERFFRAVRAKREQMPVYTDEIQNNNTGCYTSLSRIKRAHRACESLMAVVERMAALAWWLGRAPYPQADLLTAWKDILFCEFHDILPGACTAPVERDALAALGRCSEILRRVKLRLFLSLLRDEPACRDGVTPIFLWNPHGFRADVTTECQFHYEAPFPSPPDELRFEVRDAVSGRKLPFQRERTTTPVEHDWRVQLVRLAIPVSLDPFAMRRLEVSWHRRARPKPWKTPSVSRHLQYTGRRYRVRINPRTGLVDFAGPRRARTSWLRAGALRPIAWEDMEHAWICGDPNRFPHTDRDGLAQAPPWKTKRGAFRLATPAQTARILSPPSLRWGAKRKPPSVPPIRVVEHGPVRTIVEAVFVMGGSWIVRRYVMSQDGFEVRDRIFWNEREAMLKLAVPLAFRAANTVSETPYAAITRPAQREHAEQVNQRWVTATEGIGRAGTGGRFTAVLNTGSHAHSLWRDTLHISILRSPTHSAMHMRPNLDFHMDRYWPHHDQGEHETRFRFVFGRNFDEVAVSRDADLFNAPPEWLVHHPWRVPKKAKSTLVADPFVSVSADNVRIAAIKRAESGRGLGKRPWTRRSPARGGRQGHKRLGELARREECREDARARVWSEDVDHTPPRSSNLRAGD